MWLLQKGGVDPEESHLKVDSIATSKIPMIFLKMDLRGVRSETCQEPTSLFEKTLAASSPLVLLNWLGCSKPPAPGIRVVKTEEPLAHERRLGVDLNVVSSRLLGEECLPQECLGPPWQGSGPSKPYNIYIYIYLRARILRVLRICRECLGPNTGH